MKAVIAMTMKPFAQEIRIDDASAYIHISQDHDEVCVSAEQWKSFLYAIVQAAKEKGWIKAAEVRNA